MKPVGLEDPRRAPRGRPAAAGGSRGHRSGTSSAARRSFGSGSRSGSSACCGLGEAVFARFGSIHRNTPTSMPLSSSTIVSRKALPASISPARWPASRLRRVGRARLPGRCRRRARATRATEGRPPAETAHGALLRHLQNADAKHFQPMNVNYGLFPALPREVLRPPKPGGGRGKTPEAGEEPEARGARAPITSLSSRRRCPRNRGRRMNWSQAVDGFGRHLGIEQGSRRIRAARTSPTCAS